MDEIKRLYPLVYRIMIEEPWDKPQTTPFNIHKPGYAFFLAQKAKLKQKAKEKTPV